MWSSRFFIRRNASLVYAGTANAVIHSSTFFFFGRRFSIPLHGDYHMLTGTLQNSEKGNKDLIFVLAIVRAEAICANTVSTIILRQILRTARQEKHRQRVKIITSYSFKIRE